MNLQTVLSQRALSLKQAKLAAIVAAGALATTSAVNAFTTPSAGDLGYDIYDIVVLQGIQGAPGFVAAVIFVAFGFGALFRQQILLGIFGLIAAAALFAADAVVQSLGFVI